MCGILEKDGGGKIVNNSYIMYADETVISIRRI
jgi:hypothetical protein